MAEAKTTACRLRIGNCVLGSNRDSRCAVYGTRTNLWKKRLLKRGVHGTQRHADFSSPAVPGQQKGRWTFDVPRKKKRRVECSRPFCAMTRLPPTRFQQHQRFSRHLRFVYRQPTAAAPDSPPGAGVCHCQPALFFRTLQHLVCWETAFSPLPGPQCDTPVQCPHLTENMKARQWHLLRW